MLKLITAISMVVLLSACAGMSGDGAYRDGRMNMGNNGATWFNAPSMPSLFPGGGPPGSDWTGIGSSR